MLYGDGGVHLGIGDEGLDVIPVFALGAVVVRAGWGQVMSLDKCEQLRAADDYRRRLSHLFLAESSFLEDTVFQVRVGNDLKAPRLAIGGGRRISGSLQ